MDYDKSKEMYKDVAAPFQQSWPFLLKMSA